jgi:L-amino acid N-acyltransferase YncA
MSIRLRPAVEEDAEAIARIYNHYVRDTVVTFEELELSTTEMALRIREVREASLPWLVAEQGDGVVGYSYVSTWKTRSAYRHSVESTVYLDPRCTGAGIGTLLYSALVSAAEARSLHVMIGGISLPNAASVALHEKLGFTPIGTFSEVGFKLGRWVDVGYWQKILLVS